VYALLQLPLDSLDDEQLQNLRNISRHFGIGDEGPRRKKTKRSDGPAKPSAKPKSKTTKSSATVPEDSADSEPDEADAPVPVETPEKLKRWHPITKLESLTLAQVAKDHFEAYKTDATEFLKVNADYYAEDARRPHGAIVESYHYANSLKASDEKGRICTIFVWLFWWDVLKSTRPTAAGTHISEAMIAEMLDSLKPEENTQEDWIEEIRNKPALANIAKWAAAGKKVQTILVDKFTIGSVFFLAHQLSENFVANKITSSGYEYEVAMSHLDKKLHLGGIIFKNGWVVELGNNIRKHFKAAFPHMQSEQDG
jgi:hypothetical protein